MAKKKSGSKPRSSDKKKNTRANTPKPVDADHSSGQTVSKNGFPIVAVGASAGGLEAFEQLLSAVPSDIGMAFVLIPHLAPKHESLMGELLSKYSSLPIIQVTDGTPVRPNRVYIIPPNADIRIDGGVLYLSELRDGPARRLSIDHFMRSLAQDEQNRAIGVILSGTASDGTLGLQAIKAQGGITFAQDEKSAKYASMPRNAIASGMVDFVLPPDQIAHELVRIGRHMKLLPPGQDSVEESSDRHLAQILSLLKNYRQVDFGFYKHGTIRRRLVRRLLLRKIDSLQSYVKFLERNPDEIDALFHDILINVTGFFRDPEAFDALKAIAFPALLANRAPEAPIRAWVPGCSSGEEAYSVAISLLEFLGENAGSVEIQIFATDLSENIIQRARAGIYPENIAIDLTPERLRRFFQKVDGGYQVNKAIRDVCVFAKQDITRDPPFSRLDIISCRNVMIYMSQILQKRVLPLFHYALNPGGILFLGSSENISSYQDLFNSMDKKYKIYSKKPVAVSINFEFVPSLLRVAHSKQNQNPEVDGNVSSKHLQSAADQILLNRYAPASVVVNQNLDIVQFIGNTGPYLSPSPGDASLNLLRMVKKGLLLELRLAFQRIKPDTTLRKEGLLIEQNGGFITVNVEILPIRTVGGKERFHIISFEDAGKSMDGAKGKGKADAASSGKPQRVAAREAEVGRLKEELDSTREYLQSIIEEQRSTNEELRSANEEIQSSNEELQSINEELETAKEELQSTNEELTTVNEELQNRNDELIAVNNDLSNLLSSVNIPIVMLGNDLKIRRFTPLAERIMNLIPSDIGRPITDIQPNLKVDNLSGLVTGVIDTLKIHDTEVEDQAGKRYVMRIRPYRTIDNKIDGVVIVLLDLPKPGASLMKPEARKGKASKTYSIDAETLENVLKEIESKQEEIATLSHRLAIASEALASLNDRYDGLLTLAPAAFVTLDRSGRIRDFNDHAVTLLDGGDVLKGRPFINFVAREGVLVFRRNLVDCITANAPVTFDVLLSLRGRNVAARISMLRQWSSGNVYFLVAITDRSEMTSTQRDLEEALQRWHTLIHSAPDIILILEPDAAIAFANRPWFGNSESEMLGKDIFDYIPSNQQVTVRLCFSRALRARTIESCEIQFTDQKGKPWYSLIFGPMLPAVQDAPSRSESLCVLIRDITEQKLAELNLQRTTAMLRGLSARIEEIREEERSRIGREIHDELGQSLTVLKMDLAWLKARVGRKSAVIEERSNAMDESLDTLIQNVRRISSELRPPLLDLGLIPAIEWQLELLEKRAGIRCFTKIRQPELELDQPLSIAVFRVVQEALTNIARHSGATEIHFGLDVADGELVISLSDNGRGITMEELDSAASFGLTGMRERIHHIGGDFQIERLELGTRVTVRLPLTSFSEERKII